LSKYCGPNDVITRISPEDEKVRVNLGYRGPQNYNIPFSKYLKSHCLNLINARKRIHFYNHCSAKFVLNHIDEKQWDDYFIFCFERNPFSKIISWYQWLSKAKDRQSISLFLQSPQAFRVRGIDLYTIDSHIIADKIYRFENLNEAMADIADKVGLPEMPQLVKTKPSLTASDGKKSKVTLSEEDVDLISKVYAREIACFGYEIPRL